MSSLIKVPSKNMHCLRILILSVAYSTVEKYAVVIMTTELPRKVNGSAFNRQILQIRGAVTVKSLRVCTPVVIDVNA